MFLKKIKKFNILSFVNLIGYIDNISYQKTSLIPLINSLQINSLIECDPHHKYKSYSVNKGEELAICLRHLKEGYPFNDDYSNNLWKQNFKDKVNSH